MSEVAELCAQIRDWEIAEYAFDEFVGKARLSQAFPEVVTLQEVLDDWVALEEYVASLNAELPRDEPPA